MHNQDVELAKLRLTSQDLSLVIVKNEKIIFETKKQGITGLLEAIEILDKDLVSSSIADKIVGVAAAVLCVHAGISSVYAFTISESGIKLLKKYNINFDFNKKVTRILNRTKTDVCPFEKLAISAKTPKEAFMKVKDCAVQMMKRSAKR